MAINKVIDRNNNVLIDLTSDTVKPASVLSGTKFHGADGKEYIGQVQPNELDTFKYNFVDYDGTLMYSFTDEEIDAMTELPAGPDHTEDNLTFQEWNWSLEGLKNWDRTKCSFRPTVGANLITTDRKTYITVDVRANRKIKLRANYVDVDIDWGDGTVETGKTNDFSHTYTEAGEYEIVVDAKGLNTSWATEGGFFISSSSDAYCVTKMKLGTFGFSADIVQYCNVEYVNVPKFESSLFATNSTPYIGCGFAKAAKFLKAIVLPRNALLKNKSLYSSGTNNEMLNNCYSLELISFGENIECDTGITWSRLTSLDKFLPILTFKPNSNSPVMENYETGVKIFDYSAVKTSDDAYPFAISINSSSSAKKVIIPDSGAKLGSSAFYQCKALRDISLPDITDIPGSSFYTCIALRYLLIPDSVQTIGNGVFASADNLILDLSKQTKVITASGSLGLPTNSSYLGKILVPASLLDAYKSASYWSQHAMMMVGV